eukprot:jgi/Hompol1/2298/HPOL_005403-RA
MRQLSDSRVETKVHTQLTNAKICIRLNPDYKEPTLNYAARLRTKTESPAWSRWFRSLFFPLPEQETTIPMTGPLMWEGLRRFQEKPDGASDASKLEYAQVADVLNCKLLDVSFITTLQDSELESRKCNTEITDGLLHFGPWTQRQRNILQSFFSPQSYRDRIPVHLSSSIDNGLFVLQVRFLGNSMLKVPIREPSKDREFYEAENPDHAFRDGSKRTKRRPYAWLELDLTTSSTAVLKVPFTPRSYGFKTSFVITAINSTLRTSVNHKPLIVGKHISLEFILESPLAWNGLRDWQIIWKLADCDVFLLREHVSLFADLIRDLNSLPPPALEYFVPSVYTISLNLQRVKFLLNTNKMNITAHHNSLSEN